MRPSVGSGDARREDRGDARTGCELTNLDQPLFDGAEATKRDLVDYLDAVRDRILPELRDRPLSVIRMRPGQEPFMQKNVPKYTPDWVRTTTRLGGGVAAARCTTRCATTGARCCGSPTSASVEYHPTLDARRRRATPRT